MIFDLQKHLLSLASHSQEAASLLRAAVCNGCRSCVSQISDLNRQALSDLTDAERELLTEGGNPCALSSVHALASCISYAFSAAMLIPQELPHLPPLSEIVSANELLAAYPRQILQAADTPPFYQIHLCANKGRGAHAILVTHYCVSRSDFSLLPLALALENHRNAIEHACGELMHLSANRGATRSNTTDKP